MQDATISAEMVPAVLTIFEIVTPLDGFPLVTVTTIEPLAVSVSVTVAMFEFDAAVPCCLLALIPVTTGASLMTLSVNEASVVKPQLSVARIVIVCDPVGVALLIETIPVTLSTEIVPV